MVAGKHPTRASEACLHLVHDEEDITFIAQCLQAFQIFGASEADTPFSLHHLDDHRRGVTVDGFAHRFQIVVGDMAELRDQRLKGLPVLLFPGSAQGSHGPAVEPAHGGNDARSAGRHTCEFDGCLYRLGSRITEKNALQTFGRDFGKFGHGLCPLVVIEAGRQRNEALSLLADRFRHIRVIVPDDGYTVPAHAVDIFVSFVVPQNSAVPAHDHQIFLRNYAARMEFLQRDNIHDRFILSLPC